MAPQNNHSHAVDTGPAEAGRLKAAFWLNLTFTVVELVGGIWVNSVAIISDAIHDMGDSLSLGSAWFLERFSQRPASPRFSYGYRRFSLLAALINALVLIGGSAYMISQAIQRFRAPEPVYSEGMILMGVAGLLFNGLAYWRMHRGASINTRVISLHLLEDVLGWVAVLIGAGVMYFYPLYWIDPLLSLLIAVFILFNAFKSLVPTLRVLLQATPPSHKISTIRNLILSEDVVEDVHDLHIWSLDGQYHILTANLVVAAHHSMQELAHEKSRIKSRLEQAGILHSTLEFEIAAENCHLNHCLEMPGMVTREGSQQR